LDGGSLAGPLYWIATGSTASRSAQDRSAERRNIKDWGALLNGSDDTTNALAAYNATPANGTLFVPAGNWNASNAAFVRGGGTGNILFSADAITGTQFPSGLQYLGDGDTVETMFGGRKGFYKQLMTSSNGFCTLEVGMHNNNPASVGVISSLLVNGRSFANAGGFTWVNNTLLESYDSNPNQDVAVASRVHKFGTAPTWAWFSSSQDMTGLRANLTGALIGMEMDMQANGPEPATTIFQPNTGERVGVNFAIKSWQPPAWQVAHAYTVSVVGPASTPNSVVQPVTANGFVYVCTVAGNSGSTEPVWPTTIGTTVTDGGVTWNCSTTLNQQFSRILNAGGSADTQVGSFIYTSHAYYDAILEFSGATLVDGGVNDAAIRLAVNMPIDFSGAQSTGTQNNRTLRYNSTSGCFEYQTFGNVRLSILDGPGSVGIGGTPTTGYQFEVFGSNTVGISTAAGTFTTALRVASDQRIGLTATDAAYLQYRSATSRLYYVVGGVDMWSVDQAGNVRARGTVTGSTTP
jgi:hypothetical protein